MFCSGAFTKASTVAIKQEWARTFVVTSTLEAVGAGENGEDDVVEGTVVKLELVARSNVVVVFTVRWLSVTIHIKEGLYCFTL